MTSGLAIALANLSLLDLLRWRPDASLATLIISPDFLSPIVKLAPLAWPGMGGLMPSASFGTLDALFVRLNEKLRCISSSDFVFFRPNVPGAFR